jgi:hypothetical protein
MKTIELIDSEQEVAAVIKIESITDFSFTGDVLTVNGWDENWNEYCDEEFFAKVYAKGDSCTHFWFNGERYDSEDKSGNDSYYHICGIDGHLLFMRNTAFVLEVLSEKIGLISEHDRKDYENFKKMNLLDGYTIVYNLD